MALQVRVISSRTVYEGRVVKLRVDRIVEPGGVEATREIVTHPGSVVVLPVLRGNRMGKGGTWRDGASLRLQRAGAPEDPSE